MARYANLHAMKRLTRIGGNVLSGMPLDRIAQLRTDDAWLRARLTDSGTRFVAIWRQKVIVRLGPEPRTMIHSPETLDGLLDRRVEPAFLGVEEDENGVGAAHFVVDLSHLEPEALLDRSPGGEIMDLRELVQIVPGPDSALVAYARGLTYWHSRHRFCGSCGALTESRDAGHQRVCTNADCGATHFPRTDSAVIVLVHDGDECLLCRQSRWPPGMHSTLAGFLEPGESLEECVAREIFEESGIRVGDVRYHSSQPWPFPGTIMVGFMAQALTKDISVDEVELEYARWYRRTDLIGRPDTDEFRMPGDYSISRRLIEDWLVGRIPP
jgi:NAD+ diphosphatase